MTSLNISVRDGIARLSLDVAGAPVNTISKQVRDELAAALTRLAADGAVRSVLLRSGKPDGFIAGADIEEFARLGSREAALALVREGQALIQRLAGFGKPIVAAIHGACLGGGLEAALACTYRVGTDHPKTTLGLPEVQLGIIPAAGGCQRLPRLIGLRNALDLILAGRTVPASRALRLGMIDELVHPAILDSVATAAARRLADGWRPSRRTRFGRRLEGSLAGRHLIALLARRSLTGRTGGHYPAPGAALDAVVFGLGHGITRGLEREATAFADLAVGEVSRKLVQIFFATRALKKDFGGEAGAGPRGTRAVAVVGAGFMGSAIAGVAATQAHVDVRLKDSDVARVSRGIANARGVARERLARRRITPFEYRRLAALVSGGADWAGFPKAELVIEAVFEDLTIKRAVFRDLEAHTSPDCVLASNTSTIPISQIVAGMARPERAIGMHFFSPVDRMPLLEVIPGERTSAATTASAVAFGHRIGKTVIVVRDSPGFWVNRILAPYINEAVRLVSEGQDVIAVDRVMTRFGFPVGPLTLVDEVGLDVGDHASQVLHDAFGERMTPVAGMRAIINAGDLGRKSGRGLYRYVKGKRNGVNHDAVGRLRAGLGSVRTSSPDVEARLVYAMLNEAARAVTERVVRSPRDGDIGAIYGIGFPPFRGGPLRYLDDLGSANAVATLERLASQYGARFAPAPGLVDMARSGARFYAT